MKTTFGTILLFTLIVSSTSYSQAPDISGKWFCNYLLMGKMVLDEINIEQEGESFSGIDINYRNGQEYFFNISGKLVSDSTFTLVLNGAKNHLKLIETKRGLCLRLYDQNMKIVPEGKNYATHYYRNVLPKN